MGNLFSKCVCVSRKGEDGEENITVEGVKEVQGEDTCVGSEDSLDEPWGADSGAEATEETEESRSREGVESGETSVASVVSRESLNEEPSAENVVKSTSSAPNTFHRSGSERIKKGARALLRRMESFKGGVGVSKGGSGGWRRRKRRGAGSEDGGMDFISDPMVQDPESMEQKVRELNCVDVSPTNGEPPVGGSLASPEASAGKEARRLLRCLRQRTLSSEDGRAGALSDSECHTFSSATPKWQQLLMKSTYSIQPSERRLEEHEVTLKSTSLIKQRYKSRRAASLNLGTSTKPFREGLLLGNEDKEGRRPVSETEMTGAVAREEEVITRTRPGRRWLEETTGEQGSVYDNVPVVILNRSYREDTGPGFESHIEESVDTSIPKKWLSNTTVVRWHSFQSCGADSRKRSALGRSRSDGSKASSDVRHGSSRSSSRHKISTKASVQDVILSSSPSKHRRESLSHPFGEIRDVESLKCSSEGIEGPRTLALHGKDVAMCVALGFADAPLLPHGDVNVPKDKKQGQPVSQVLELTPIPKEPKDKKPLKESEDSETNAESRVDLKEKDSVNSKTPPLQRSPRVSEEDAPSSPSVSPSHSEDKEFRSPHIQSLGRDSFDRMKSLSKDEEDGTVISALSCGQMLALRKPAQLHLTALMERHSSSSVVGGGSHHRSGSPSSTGSTSTAGGSWSWELPQILLLRRSKAPDFKDKRVFGVPLWVCLQRSGEGIPIPPPITAALSWLRVNALNQVGLFRRSGVKSRIARLKAASEEAGWEIYSEGTMKQDELVLVDSTEESGNKAVGGAKFAYLNDQQAYDVADMVKLYFRELPEALLSSKLSDTFISVFQHVPEGQSKEAIQCLLLLLPDENREVLQTLLDFLAQVQDPESMEQKVRELNCVDVSPTNGEPPVGGSLASPEASAGKEARRLLRRLRQRTLSSEDGRAGALSDSECHTFSSATPKWQQLLMKSTYSIQPSERRLEEHEVTLKSTSLIKQRYKSRRAASLNLGTSTKPFREGLLLGNEDKEGRRPVSETEMTGAVAREEEVITRTRPGRRWLEETTGEQGSVYDNVPVVILNRSYREDTGPGFESHIEESVDTSIPKKWLSNTTVVRWHSFQSCGADSRKRSALGRSRSDGSKASSDVRHGSSRSSSRHKISTKASVQDVILSSSPSKHRRESLSHPFGEIRDVESLKCSSEGIEGPRTLALHGKDVAMCVALGFADAPLLPHGDVNVPKDKKQGQPVSQVLELTPIPKEPKDKKPLKESEDSETNAESRVDLKEKDSVNSKTPPLQRSPRVSEEDAPSSPSVSPSHSEDKEFRSPHIQSLGRDSFDRMKSLSKDEEDGTVISALSCGQMLALRKPAQLHLTALMERHSSSSVVGGGSHHRSGSPSSTGSTSTAGGSWSWELPQILLLRRSKAPDFKDKRVFGVPLWVCLQRSGEGIPIPPPITAALSWLRVNALNQVGLFRRSGVKSRIARLKAASEEAGWEIYSEGTMKQDELVLVDSTEESGNKAVGGAKFAYLNDQQAYDVADMVKLYFRELPEALLSSKLSDTFISVFQHVPEGQSKEAIQCLLLLLPDENREVLQTLLDFLAQGANTRLVQAQLCSSGGLPFGPHTRVFQACRKWTGE